MTFHGWTHYLGTISFYGFRYAVTLIGILIGLFVCRYAWLRIFRNRPDRDIRMTSDGVVRVLTAGAVSAALFLMPVLDGGFFNLGLGDHPPITSTQMALFYVMLVSLFCWIATERKTIIRFSVLILIPCMIASLADLLSGKVLVP